MACHAAQMAVLCDTSVACMGQSAGQPCFHQGGLLALDTLLQGRSMASGHVQLHCRRRYGTFKDEYRLYMLMDYVSGGELFKHLRSAGCFPTTTARFYIACVISAIEHLHSHDIVYRYSWHNDARSGACMMMFHLNNAWLGP